MRLTAGAVLIDPPSLVGSEKEEGENGKLEKITRAGQVLTLEETGMEVQ